MTPEQLKASFSMPFKENLLRRDREKELAKNCTTRFKKKSNGLLKQAKLKKKNPCRKLQRMRSRLTFRKVGSG